jgi:hypothetical protein
MLVYPRGGCGNTTCHVFAADVGLLEISQAGLELAFGAGIWWHKSVPVFSV